MRQGHYYAPPAVPRRDVGICLPSCCKTPYGCARQYTCTCHDGRNNVADRVPRKSLAIILERDGHICVMTATDTERLVPQHRQGGMGGRADKHRPVNLLWLDSIMNGHIEADAAWQTTAKVFGVKVPIWVDNVARVPVFYRAERAWFRLTGDTREQVSNIEALDMMHAVYGDQYFHWKQLAEDTMAAARSGGRR